MNLLLSILLIFGALEVRFHRSFLVNLIFFQKITYMNTIWKYKNVVMRIKKRSTIGYDVNCDKITLSSLCKKIISKPCGFLLLFFFVRVILRKESESFAFQCRIYTKVCQSMFWHFIYIKKKPTKLIFLHREKAFQNKNRIFFFIIFITLFLIFFFFSSFYLCSLCLTLR